MIRMYEKYSVIFTGLQLIHVKDLTQAALVVKLLKQFAYLSRE